jgi:hypothetical protein
LRFHNSNGKANALLCTVTAYLVSSWVTLFSATILVFKINFTSYFSANLSFGCNLIRNTKPPKLLFQLLASFRPHSKLFIRLPFFKNCSHYLWDYQSYVLALTNITLLELILFSLFSIISLNFFIPSYSPYRVDRLAMDDRMSSAKSLNFLMYSKSDPFSTKTSSSFFFSL